MNLRNLGLKLGLLAVGCLVGLLGAEAMLRVYSQSSSPLAQTLSSWDPYRVPVEPYGDLGYRQRPDQTFRYWNGTHATSNSQSFRGDEVTIPKPANTFRIVISGGSTTHGWGVNDSDTISVHLQLLLRRRLPERNVEVINLAFDGYDAYQVYQRILADGLPLEPDLIVVNAGINDVRNAWLRDLVDRDPRTVLWGLGNVKSQSHPTRQHRGLWTLVKHYSYLSRFPGVIRTSLAAKARKVARPSHPPNLRAADLFEKNLSRIVEVAHDGSIPVVLSTPPSALRRYPPDERSGISYWLHDAHATETFRSLLGDRMRALVEGSTRNGYRVSYAAIDLPPDSFQDDCHLTGDGNRNMAAGLADIILPWIETAGDSAQISGTALEW